MRNPLVKRLPRELKQDMAKYLIMFLFMTILISLISGFLVADNSISIAYREGFEKYNIEDGHLAFDQAPPISIMEELEEKGNLKFYELPYFEENLNQANLRVYADREIVNTECVMSGEMPTNGQEIALDRMFAENNHIAVGDVVTVKDVNFTVSGLIAVPDYSCLYESNSDMMFDSVNFGVAVVTKECFDDFDTIHRTMNYAWKYNVPYADDEEANRLSENFLDVLEEVIEDYDKALIQAQVDDLYDRADDFSEIEKLKDTKIDESEIIKVKDYLPRYLNMAINFTGEDMGSDKAMFIIFDYILTAILAFVFAVTTSNTIQQEATVIGTLRASGFSRGELIRHYMVLPVVVTFLAALIGNVIGYSLMKNYMVNMYYGSYSLCTYTTVWNAEAFIDTTVIPLILMFVINICVIASKLRLSPLRFLRRNLSRKPKKKAFRLNTKIPIMIRFRIRIIFQNIPNYITMGLGIMLGGMIIIFGTMFGPLLDDYSELIVQSKLANYQYILMEQKETKTEGAEKYCLTSLETLNDEYVKDGVSVYGIEKDSKYLAKQPKQGTILLSNGYAIKYGISVGDVVTLKDPYEKTYYDFTVGDIITYDAAMAIFMDREDYINQFHEDAEYFTGYFSNQEITDIDEDDIAGVITVDDLNKVSRQLKISIGGFMGLFKVFGVIIFLLLMYLMSKQVIEKNAQSISMTKILGYTGGEIGGLYILATSVVVLLSLLVTVPISDGILHYMFTSFIYKRMSGYIPYIISGDCYLLMITLGIVSYAFVAVFLMFKINRIPKSDALKNVE